EIQLIAVLPATCEAHPACFICRFGIRICRGFVASLAARSQGLRGRGLDRFDFEFKYLLCIPHVRLLLSRHEVQSMAYDMVARCGGTVLHTLSAVDVSSSEGELASAVLYPSSACRALLCCECLGRHTFSGLYVFF